MVTITPADITMDTQAIFVSQYNAINEICFFALSSCDESTREIMRSPQSIGVWKIKAPE